MSHTYEIGQRVTYTVKGATPFGSLTAAIPLPAEVIAVTPRRGDDIVTLDLMPDSPELLPYAVHADDPNLRPA